MLTEPKPADIVLYPVVKRSELASKLVGWGEKLFGEGGKVQYSHCAVLYYSTRSSGWEYEAKWPISGCYRIDETRPREIWRIKGISAQQRKEVLRWCAKHCGELYGLLALPTFGLIQSVHMPVCSQFVGESFASQGFHFKKDKLPILSPDDIAKSKLVERIS